MSDVGAIPEDEDESSLTATCHRMAPVPGLRSCEERGTLVTLMPYLLGAVLTAAPSAPAELPSPTVPDGLGVNIHFTGAPARDLDMLQAGGFRFIRMDFHWSAVEKEKGVYSFKGYDDLTEGLAQRGIRPLYILDYSNKLYEEQNSVRTEEGRQAFARFAAAAAERYRGRGVLWELWNEPNIGFWQPQPGVNDYMALAKAVLPAIRKADPQALRVAPATSGVPLDFLEECFRQGMLQMVEAVTVHPYRQQSPETAVRDCQRLRALIARYRPDRPDLPVISGEWGYSTVWGSYNDERQGHALPRQFLTNLSQGIPLSIWYDWHDDGPDPKEAEHHFGTVTLDYKPKPSYLAMQRLVEALKGMRFVKRLQSKPEEWLLLFSDGQRRTLAAWTTGAAHEAEPIPGQKVQLTEAPQYLPVPATAEAILAEAGWTVVQRSVGARGGEPVGGALAPAFEVSVANPFSRPLPVRLSVEPGKGVTGKLDGAGSFTMAPGARKSVRWRGRAVRGEAPEMPVVVKADLGGFAGSQEVAFILTNPLSVEVVPGARDGVAVAIRNPSGDPFKGTLDILSRGARQRCALEMRPGTATVKPAGGAGLAPTATVSGDQVRIALPQQSGEGVRVVLTEAGSVVADSGMVRFVPLAVTTETARAFNDGDAKVPAKFELAAADLEGPDAPAKRGLRFLYDYAKGWKFVRIAPAQDVPVEGQPRAVSVWVRGDNSGNLLRLRYIDGNGRCFQPDFGRLDFTGWRLLTARLDDPHVGKWGGEGNPDQIRYPIRLNTFVLLDGHGAETKGDVAFADFRLIYRDK